MNHFIRIFFRREGRRSSYGQYGDLMPDSPPQCNTPLGQNTNAINQLNAFNNSQLAALGVQPNALTIQLAALAAMQNQALNGNSSSQQQTRRRGTNGSQGATSSGNF